MVKKVNERVRWVTSSSSVANAVADAAIEGPLHRTGIASLNLQVRTGCW